MPSTYRSVRVPGTILLGLFLSILPVATTVAHAATISITSCPQLEAIGSTTTEPVSGSYLLANNIDCSYTQTENPNGGGGYYGFGALPSFYGTFDGGGHTITNLYMNRPNYVLGLFSTLEGTSTVKNLNLLGGSMTGVEYLGAVAGEMHASSTIQNVTSSVAVSSQGYTGGLVGLGDSAAATIASSSSSGTVSTTANAGDAGGLAGSFAGTIINSSSSGMLAVPGASDSLGGIAGTNSGSIIHSHSSESIMIAGQATNIGGLVGHNLNVIQGSYFTGSIDASTTNAIADGIDGVVGYDTSTNGITNTFYNTDVAYIMGMHRETRYGIYSNLFSAWAAGSYTPLSFSTYFPSTDANGFYDITNLADLKNLLGFVDTDLSARSFKITAPIALPSEFIIPHWNASVLDGGSNAITGLSISRANLNPYLGGSLIPQTVGSTTITNMNLVNVNVTSGTASGIVGTLDGTLSNSTVSGTVNAWYEGGGAVAQLVDTYDTVRNVQSSVNVNGITNANGTNPNYLGGLVGYNYGIVDSSSASGMVSSTLDSTYALGGLIGESDNVITHSYATGAVMSSGLSTESVGGLAGTASGPISGSYATGAVTVSGDNAEYVGGLAGVTTADLTNSYATGAVTVNGNNAQYVGGLVGSNDGGNVASTSASGVVTVLGNASAYVGGLLGVSYYTISDSYATGNVVGSTTSQYIGGLDGNVDSGSVTQCYATGNVTGNNMVGGFAGVTYAPITTSFSTGTVTAVGANAQYLGGFAGAIEIPSHDDYSTGSITVGDAAAASSLGYSGGFAGEIDAGIANVYSTGSITGPIQSSAVGYIGGLVGYNNSSSIANSYSTGAGAVISTLSSTVLTVGYDIGDTTNSSLSNLAQFAQGTPAIGTDSAAAGAPDATLAARGYGTDESTLSHFYVTTHPVYAQGQNGAWDFSTIWYAHPSTFPTFQWFSGALPTPPVPPPASTPTPVAAVSGGGSSGGSVPNQVSNLLQQGKTAAAAALAQQYPSLFPAGATGASNGSSTTATSCTAQLYPTQPIRLGAKNDPSQVMLLQEYLNTYEHAQLPVDGTYSAQDEAAVIAWQEKYAATILTPWHLTVGTGYVYTTSLQEFKNLFLAQCQPIGSSSVAGYAAMSTSSASTRDLQSGMSGDDVRALQQMLIDKASGSAAEALAKSGASGYFGPLTKSALIEFQNAAGITPASGYDGPITRAYLAAHS